MGLYKDLIVKKKTTAIIQIVFAPKWMIEATAQLILTNPSTNDIFEYNVKGVAEEPLAEGHIIIPCQARKTSKKDILIENRTN